MTDSDKMAKVVAAALAADKIENACYTNHCISFQIEEETRWGFNKDFTFSKQNKFELVFEVTLE
jgi:hypothetical protein